MPASGGKRRWWHLTIGGTILLVALAGLAIWWSLPRTRAGVYLALGRPAAAWEAALQVEPGEAQDLLLEACMRAPVIAGGETTTAWEAGLLWGGGPYWTRFGPQGRLLRRYRTKDTELLAGFIPDREVITLGEPLWLTFHVRNVGGAEYRFRAGGDYLGSPRPASFSITAIDEQGQGVPDPDPRTGTYWGNGWNRALGEGEAYDRRLLIGDWLALGSPGRYILVARRALGSKEDEREHLDDASRFVTVATRFHLEVLPPDPERLLRLIRELEVRALTTGDDDAERTLTVIEDRAAAPALIRVLTRGQGGHHWIIRALVRFPGPETFAALLEVVRGDDPGMARAAASTLQELGQLDNAAAVLLEEAGSGAVLERVGAVQGLEHLGSKAVIPSLVELLPSADEEVQVALMLALHSLGQPLEPAWLKPHLPGVAVEVSGYESTLIESLAGRDPPGTTRLLIDCLELEDGLPECPANLYLLRCLSRGLTGHRLAAREPVDRWVSASPAEVQADRQSIRALIQRLKAWRAGAE